MAYVRFPIPTFDNKAFRGLDWVPPAYLSDAEIAAKAGESDARGAFPVRPDDGIFDRFDIEGEHRHAYLCRVPAGTRLVGRSHAWWLQRALLLDSLDPAAANIIADWRTPRPVNTRFGPEHGIELDGAPLYVISCHAHADNWVGNRTLTQDFDGGFRILGTSKNGTAKFDETCLTFTWGA